MTPKSVVKMENSGSFVEFTPKCVLSAYKLNFLYLNEKSNFRHVFLIKKKKRKEVEKIYYLAISRPNLSNTILVLYRRISFDLLCKFVSFWLSSSINFSYRLTATYIEFRWAAHESVVKTYTANKNHNSLLNSIQKKIYK